MAGDPRVKWLAGRFRLPDNVGAVTCSTVCVHPWTYGVGDVQESGNYLSPVNAVASMAQRLKSASGPVAVVALLLTATRSEDFQSQIAMLAGAFPLPALTQLQRQAAAASRIAIEKMQKPGGLTGGLPAPAPLSVSTLRVAQTAQRAEQAANSAAMPASIDAMKAALARLKQQKEAARTVEKTKPAAVPVWFFADVGDASSIASEMVKDIPQPAAVFSVGVLFVSEDLTALREMIQWPVL